MLPGPTPGTPLAPTGAGGFAVVDVEATGRSPWRHRVVEVAVVLLDERLRPEAEFCTLLDPLGPVGPTHVHRIAQADVEGAPRFREIAPRLLELLAGRVLVGHHVTCDHAFLDREFARIGVALPPVPLLCTMRLARDHLPQARGFGLAACVEAAGLGRFPAHTALGDARATADLLRHCAGAASCPPDDWAVPLREAARVPWPQLGRARSHPSDEPVLLVRRDPLPGLHPWPDSETGATAEPVGAPDGGPLSGFPVQASGPASGEPVEQPRQAPEGSPCSPAYGLRPPRSRPPAEVRKETGAMGSSA
ncbi:3'-5' exonuclease [Kitasatospora sp. A2-31]|uniref:3'-5' exonuclease n=1 Tax=Kitasatospora sp. A2-31 TaxID=2916414 RepID=UPI001EEAAD26|nr:3'-5' exonuclease [Kitasatospora sp. A2-31]MCG6497268.1 3'-5' exonuclease [Kitasatospora sp. A2-31]